jgi:hypothetical protein
MSVTRQMPTAEDFIQAALTALRAPLKEKFVSTAAGNTRHKTSGERTLYAPNGEPLRVIEDPSGGTQIEHGNSLHAVVRPKTAILKLAKR